MLQVGLSGGIGSGKSTVSKRLAELGAVIIDSDLLARQVVSPGSPGLAAVAERFGAGVIAADGSLDRPAMAAIVFAEPTARRDLEAITHPLIRAESERLVAAAPAGSVVVHDVPLLVEKRMGPAYHLVVIVSAREDVRVERLERLRGVPRPEALARIAAQATDDERHAAADVLLDNNGAPENLVAQVDSLWNDRLMPYAVNLREGRRSHRGARPEMVAADPEWRWTAARLVRRIRWALEQESAGETLVGADHIGSTSVEGLAAKDVIDLQLRVRDLADADRPAFRAAMLRAGYLLSEGNDIDDIHPWAPSPDEWAKRFYGGMDPGQIVHVHVRRHDSAAAWSALLFRDWLRSVPSEREAYAEMKRHTAQAVSSRGGTTEQYTLGKAGWIADALGRARAWAEASGWRGPQPLP